MRKSLVVTVAVVVLLVSLPAGAGSPSPADYALMHGSARIVTVSGTMLAVVVTPAQNATLRHVFRIGFDAPVSTLRVAIRSASVEFRGGELVVMAADEQLFYRFIVKGQESPLSRAPRGFTAAEYAGIGISHTILHVDDPPSTPPSSDVSTADFCSDCELTYVGPDDWALGAVSCSQGGAGATSCSVEALGFSCSVSCASGYYACCNVRTGCKCVRG
jgi:hypothetical protein